MGYILIKSDVAKEKGFKYYEKMPDGRAIMDFGMLRVLGSVSDVEIVATLKELKAKIKEQEESGIYNEEIIEEGAVADAATPEEETSDTTTQEDTTEAAEPTEEDVVVEESTEVTNEEETTTQEEGVTNE